MVVFLGAALGKVQHVKYKSINPKYSKSSAAYRSNYNEPYAPNFPAFSPQPFIDPYEFHNQLTAYIQGQQYQQNRWDSFFYCVLDGLKKLLLIGVYTMTGLE